MPDLCAEKKRPFGSGHCPTAGPGPDDGLARGAPEQRRARISTQAGAAHGVGTASGGLVGSEEDDAGAVEAGCGQAGGGLEPRADRRAFPEGGRPDGWPSVDLHARPCRSEGGRRALPVPLRRRGKKPNWKGGRHAGRGHIPDRVDISERSAIVEAKERTGDWEVDTIVGKGHSGALVSLVERASKYTLLQRVERRTADAVGAALLLLLPLQALVHTITADNGKEFAGHAWVAQALGAGFFFATPYHAWERGLNEHVNGLVREYFPKGTDFRTVPDAQVKAVQDRLNARPRKALGYRTPAEAFHKAQPP